MNSDKEDLCLITHGPEAPSDDVQKRRSAAQVIDIFVGYLVVRLNEHYSVAKVPEASLDRHLDTTELLSSAAHALLRR